eukprot:scaffold101247_cov66-Phaeocystis_antarctica.AAC.2
MPGSHNPSVLTYLLSDLPACRGPTAAPMWSPLRSQAMTCSRDGAGCSARCARLAAARIGHHHRRRREAELGAGLSAGASVDPHVVLDGAQEDVEGAVGVALDGLAQLHGAPVRLEEVGGDGDEDGGGLRDEARDVLDLVEAEPVEEGLVRHRGESVVPAEHDILGVGDLVREEDVEGLGAPIPLELKLRRLPGGRSAQLLGLHRRALLLGRRQIDFAVKEGHDTLHDLQHARRLVLELPRDRDRGEGGRQLGQEGSPRRVEDVLGEGSVALGSPLGLRHHDELALLAELDSAREERDGARIV